MKVEAVKEAYRMLRNAEYLETFANQISDKGVFLVTPTGYFGSTSPATLSISAEDAPFICRALKAGAADLIAAAKALGVEE